MRCSKSTASPRPRAPRLAPLAERTERRIRIVVGAFERELAARVAAIDAEADAAGRPQPLTADELAALQRAVRALARELTGAPP